MCEMPLNHSFCADHETAELYATEQLSPAAVENFEEHLMVCAYCVDRVEGAYQYLNGYRAAAASLYWIN